MCLRFMRAEENLPRLRPHLCLRLRRSRALQDRPSRDSLHCNPDNRFLRSPGSLVSPELSNRDKGSTIPISRNNSRNRDHRKTNKAACLLRC